MKKILTLNKIDPKGTDRFDGAAYEISDSCTNPDGILVRSAKMHDMALPDSLTCIARCGAGTNNIPIDACTEKGIVVFNTPGANANGVKELVIASLLLSSRDIIGAVEWVGTLEKNDEVGKLVEKNKSNFAGPEIKGKTLGVIGLGAIGGMVANTAIHLGMEVVGCDPYLTVNAAWSLSHHILRADVYDQVYACADYITIHVPSLDSTKGMIDDEAISKMKPGVKIINLSRGDIVDTAAIKKAIENGIVSCYITDFPEAELIGVKGVIAIPHLGASTPESEENCAVMAADQVMEYIENGNIRNSVNYPEIYLPRATNSRVIVLHNNIPNMISHISGVLSASGINIESMLSHSKGNNAVSLFDASEAPSEETIAKIAEVQGIVRVLSV